jgi:MFS family permease
MSNTFVALCIASVIYAIGSGLEEVIISPIVEALPGEQKESAMSILHSFYCWGHVGMVLLSTAYLVLLPQKWFILPILWAIVPLCSLLLFLFVPIRMLNEESSEHSMPILKLFKTKLFWLFMILMVCGGAAEQVMAQWSSPFAESQLGVSKLIGNLLGPCFFALMMAITRTFYGKYADRLPLLKALIICSCITVVGYLTACLVPIPYVALIGCGIVGIGVALYWPGVLSVSAKALPAGGASMFAILALFGDLGCSVGPQLTAIVSQTIGNDLKYGLLASLIFPIVIGVSITIYIKRKKEDKQASDT